MIRYPLTYPLNTSSNTLFDLFSFSCFYRHVNPDGTIDTVGPRLIVKGDSTTETKGSTKLSDFLVTAKRHR